MNQSGGYDPYQDDGGRPGDEAWYPSAYHDDEVHYDDDPYGCDCGDHHTDLIDPFDETVDGDGLRSSFGADEPMLASAGAAAGASGGSGQGSAGWRPGPVTRRRFIQGLAAAGALGYGVVRGAKPVELSSVESAVASKSANTGGEVAIEPLVSGGSPELQVAAPTMDAEIEPVIDENLLVAAPIDQRILVLIDLAGGNDGLSTVVPYASGAYYDLRPNLATAAEDVLRLDDQVGLAPALGRLHQRQLATVEGVGPIDGVLSHFEMVDRWAQGDMLGQGGQRSGFLARLADQVDVGGAVTGLSVAGHSPHLEASRSSTLSLSNLNHLRVLINDDWIFPRYRRAVQSFGGGPMSTMMSQSWDQLVEIGDSIDTDIDKVDRESQMIREGGNLGRQLAMAAALIKADVGVRVIHAQHGGFDTHNNHNGRHNQLMGQLDAAVDGFLADIEAAGMSDRVLVATTSEFGRRVRQNGSGLDHGAGSAMLMVGPIRPGRQGEASPLNDLDRNGNLKTIVPLDRYLASLAQDWLGVEAASVLPNNPQPIGII